ncbi:transposase [Micromonospora echinospora]
MPKHARRLDGFNEAILSLYAKGLTTGEIPAHLADVYDADVSRELISRVTDSVLDDMEAWRQRPLDRVYHMHFIDALVMKIRQGQVANRPVYVVAGVSLDGERDVLGMWAGTGGEGSKQWAGYLTELRNRGVEDLFMVCSDGLKGMTDAIEQVWPQAVHQQCVVHLPPLPVPAYRRPRAASMPPHRTPAAAPGRGARPGASGLNAGQPRGR